jgi:hypothetical protein
MAEAPLRINWSPGLLRMTHPRLGPVVWMPEWDAQDVDVYPCVTYLPSEPTRVVRCPCGQVDWHLSGREWDWVRATEVDDPSPRMVDWAPEVRRMTHRRRPAEVAAVQFCVTDLDGIPPGWWAESGRLRCPCGQVVWKMTGIELEAHDVTGMSVAQVEALLDRVLPLEGPA